MPRISRRPRTKIGAPPGALVHVGQRHLTQPKVTCIHYTPEALTIEELAPEAIPAWRTAISGVAWLNITGLHDVPLMAHLGQIFGIHPLAQEDILNTTQRPKVDLFDNHLFLTLKSLKWQPGTGPVQAEQISLWLGDNFLISWQEKEPDDFEAVYQRLSHEGGRLRRLDTDYLAYTLIDGVVDNYFVAVEALDEQLAHLEENILGTSGPTLLRQLYHVKRELYALRQAVWPLREVLGKLLRHETPLVTSATTPYWRDVYDHVVQIIELTEALRDVASGLLDVHLSNLSQRTNEVMRVLTVIATFFIPITFIASVYGMNFDFMPELHWPAGYPLVLLLMLGVTLSLFWYFRRKKWF